MSDNLRLVIVTPERIVVNVIGVLAVRASDASGSFGILPRHASLLTVLPASVIRWRDIADTTHFCAVRGGVLTMSAGSEVAVACRQAQLAEHIEELELSIAAARAAEIDADRHERVVQTKLHALAARQLMQYLLPSNTKLNDLIAEQSR
jgi:F-type H+-transporting ATPase subunit epsilon